jgi:hypothetical protein
MLTRSIALSRRVLLPAFALLLLFCARPAAADPRVYLSWNGPWGSSRARPFIVPDCADSTHDDTLYVCIDPGRDTTLIGVTATLWFRPADRDTLGHAWHFDDPTVPRLRAHFGDQPACGATTPWGGLGAGGARYHALTDAGVLRMIWAVAANQAAHVDSGRVYLFGRVWRRTRDPKECKRALCIEWSPRLRTEWVETSRRNGCAQRPLNSPGARLSRGVSDPLVRPWMPPLKP